jgi:hypothetical protein
VRSLFNPVAEQQNIRDDFRTILRNRMKSLQLAGYTLPWCCTRFLRRVGGQASAVRECARASGAVRPECRRFECAGVDAHVLMSREIAHG